MNLNSDVDRISNIIQDYGLGAFGKLDSSHVSKWLDQFNNDHEIIAYETANILESNYLTEKDFKDFLSSAINLIRKEMHEKFVIIEAQGQNKSQSFMTNILKNDGISSTFFDMSRIDKNIIYIDDFIFSGQTLVSDFKKWLGTNHNVSNVTIHIITMGRYDYNANRTIDYLNKAYIDREIKFTIRSRKAYVLSDSFQLKQASLDDEDVSMYVRSNLGNTKIYPRCREGSLISNSKNRNIYEAEMTKAGIKIINLCKDPHVVMKPLGFGSLGLGFGGSLFSYRNCPNTTPLAFWWGNPNYYDANHPFRKWYPLMQRTS